MARLLIFSQGPGLGHLRRARNIAMSALALVPDCSILIIVDSQASPTFPAIEGIDHIKLPTMMRTGKQTWSGDTLQLDIQQLVDLRAQITLQTFLQFEPDAVLIHDRPVGALGELEPMLDNALQLARRPKLYLGLRDLLDMPAVVNSRWAELGADPYLDKYDAILIYDSAEFHEPKNSYRPHSYSEKIFYCDYVTLGSEFTSTPDAEYEPSVLVMGGSGLDFFPLAKAIDTGGLTYPQIPDGMAARADSKVRPTGISSTQGSITKSAEEPNFGRR